MWSVWKWCILMRTLRHWRDLGGGCFKLGRGWRRRGKLAWLGAGSGIGLIAAAGAAALEIWRDQVCLVRLRCVTASGLCLRPLIFKRCQLVFSVGMLIVLIIGTVEVFSQCAVLRHKESVVVRFTLQLVLAIWFTVRRTVAAPWATFLNELLVSLKNRKKSVNVQLGGMHRWLLHRNQSSGHWKLAHRSTFWNERRNCSFSWLS